MTTSEFVRNVVLLSEGKRETFATGATKWLRIVDLGNFYLQQFAREYGVDWNHYYDSIKTFGTVTATDTFAIPSAVQKISQQEGDYVRVMHATAYTLNGALSGAAVTSVVVNETVPTATPQTGSIRVLRNDGTYTKITYTSWTSKTFTITATNFSTNNSSNANAAYVNTELYTDYSTVSHDRLKEYSTGNYVAKVGSNVKFSKEFETTDPQYGGEILVPVYEYPDTFSGDSDVIDIPHPNWLVLMTAADRVKNDVTRKDLRADLVAQANDAMQSMREDNDSQTTDATRPWSPTSHSEEVWWQ